MSYLIHRTAIVPHGFRDYIKDSDAFERLDYKREEQKVDLYKGIFELRR